MKTWQVSGLTLAVLGALAACSSSHDMAVNTRPTWLGTITQQSYDGSSDDLLTAGLGKTGLASAVAPTFADANAPSATELRRLAIYSNYRALADMTANGGYGRLYGPNIDTQGKDTLGEGKIAGTEYLAFADDGSGRENVTLMVQVPDSFQPEKPCIIAAPASGSRGVYGAIGTTGEWGLKHGCAVAYTDRGAGNGAHELSSNTVTLIDGRLAKATDAGKLAHFAADLTESERSAYATSKPGRYAYKHAHSQRNPEKDWGRDTLRAIEFAFYVLNNRYGSPVSGTTDKSLRLTGDNTLVIASSVSNGGGAVLQAAEDDSRGLIDGVVAVEPQINLQATSSLIVNQGGTTVAGAGRSLYDYTTLAYLYQPCAALAASVADSPYGVVVNKALAANRCTSLKANGFLTSSTTAEQAQEALSKLHSAGWLADSDLLHASHFGFGVAAAVSVTYANAYKKARVSDELCGYSMGTTTTAGLPTIAATSPMTKLFGVGNGVPPTNGINLIAEKSLNGAINEAFATSASTGLADYNYDGVKCLRDLMSDSTVQASVAAISKTANLRGKPTLIVHGRSDALIPVNHTSRPYLAANTRSEGSASKLRYIEVTNAQHFEAFLAFPGYDTRLVPLHVYTLRALDRLWDHLKSGTALPPSQVIRTTPRGGTPGAAPAITYANLPDINATPASADVITTSSGKIDVPN